MNNNQDKNEKEKRPDFNRVDDPPREEPRRKVDLDNYRPKWEKK